MLSTKLKARKLAVSEGNPAPERDTAGNNYSDHAGSSDRSEYNDNVAVYPFDTLLLSGPSAIFSVIVVTGDCASDSGRMVLGYEAIIAITVFKGMILCSAVVGLTLVDEFISMVFSRITNSSLAACRCDVLSAGLCRSRG